MKILSKVALMYFVVVPCENYLCSSAKAVDIDFSFDLLFLIVEN